MKVLQGGCRVFASEDAAVTTTGTWTIRSVISKATGAKRVTQSVYDYEPGHSPDVVNPESEEVLYVQTGNGVCRIDGDEHDLRPGMGVFIPPGAAYSIENTTPDTMRVISSRCPIDEGFKATELSAKLSVHEDEREQIRAGENRIFRYLVHTDLGCRQITQFVGWIPASKAPFHLHTYEEAIYILEGRGILHLEGHLNASEFGPGSSIYLPDGVVHCLENPGPDPIRLLGVFHPSGSPGAAYETDD